MSAPCPYGSYFCSVFQTYVFLYIAELHSGWCDETGCKAFIRAYDMFIMSLTPRGIYWVSRMTCYLFTSFSLLDLHATGHAIPLCIDVFGCVCAREMEEARSRDLDNIFINSGNSCTHWSQWIQKLKDLTWVMKVSSKTLLTYSSLLTARLFEIIPKSSIYHIAVAFIVDLTLTISEFLSTSKADSLWQNTDGCIWQVKRGRKKNYWGQHGEKRNGRNLSLK